MGLDTQGARDKRLGRMVRKLAHAPGAEDDSGRSAFTVRRAGSVYGIETASGHLALGKTLEEAVAGAVDQLQGVGVEAARQWAEARSVEREIRMREGGNNGL